MSKAKALQEIKFLGNNDKIFTSLSYKGILYKIGDFVYSSPTVAGAPYSIGHIEEFDLVKPD